MDILYDWTPESMLEVTLKDPDAFLKVCETLTRIGIASKKDNTLYQSCHILHKQGKYFIVSFLEMFAIDGKQSTITINDIERRNTIAALLQEWDLLTIIHPEKYQNKSALSQIKIIPFKEKSAWILKAKYTIGNKK